ncbi:MAG TPA: hypothetical protein VF292_09790 [Rhodanobacteraceae bacterium]
MHRFITSAVIAGLGLALPLAALSQVVPMPVIPALQNAPPVIAAPPVQHKAKVQITSSARSDASVPDAATLAGGRSAHADVRVVSKPGITAHVNVDATRWAPLVPACAAAALACNNVAPVAGVRGAEVGAGYTGHGVELNLSVGRSRSNDGIAPLRAQRLQLPRVLPAASGADVAAPLWFRDSTATNVSAHGQLNLAPQTSLNVGASVGHIRFLPGSGVVSNDALDQTTLSFGIQHGSVRGSIVGHVLQPDLPGMALGENQRWSGIDLGISVRLPWRGELNFGAQNMWTSGRAPLLFGTGATPDQGRVPYVQYHQDLN